MPLVEGEQIAGSETSSLEALHQQMAAHSLAGHWQPRAKRPEMCALVWPWHAIHSCLIESGKVVQLGGADEAANRRTVQLINPGLPGQKSTSRTLQMSVQLVKPGETAECHRHSAAALRFVVEGDGTAFTNVEGEVMHMEPGDLVLTPNWAWHDHQNPGDKPVIWLDVLDTHLVSFLDAAHEESYSDANAGGGNYPSGSTQPIVKRDGYCRHRYGVLRPLRGFHGVTPPYAYKWRDTCRALEAMVAAGETDPYDGVLLEFTNPLTGGPTMPTISCRAQRLAPGEMTRSHSHTSSTIYHVVQGEGVSVVGNKKESGDELIWGTRDCFFVPPRSWHCHRNTSRSQPAILFSVTDRPVLDSLGLYREAQT